LKKVKKMKKLILGLVLGCAFLLTSCGENKNTDVLDSGTYQGVAEKVEPDEREIYVRTSDDKLVELYFTVETTVMTSDGQTSSFSALEENAKVEITVEKKGNKNVPVSVKILE
jgi:major membrane immunogen (membrane-anchored lipoprotein)